MEQLDSQLSIYLWSLGGGGGFKSPIIPTLFTWFGCNYPQIKVESPHLSFLSLFHFISNIMCRTVKLAIALSKSECFETWTGYTYKVIYSIQYIYIELSALFYLFQMSPALGFGGFSQLVFLPSSVVSLCLAFFYF